MDNIIFLVHKTNLNGFQCQHALITKSTLGELAVQIIHGPPPIQVLE